MQSPVRRAFSATLGDFNQHPDALFRVGRKTKMALRMPEKDAFNFRNIRFCRAKSEPPLTQLTCHRSTRRMCRLLRTRLFNVGRGKNSPQSGTSPSTLESRVLHNRQSGKLIVSRLERSPPLDFVHIRLDSSCACFRLGLVLAV